MFFSCLSPKQALKFSCKWSISSELSPKTVHMKCHVLIWGKMKTRGPRLFCIAHLSIYCPFNILWKDIFCLTFYSKQKCFVLIGLILSGTICLFCFYALFSNIYCNFNFMAKNRSKLCNFYSKVSFWNLYLRIYFYFSLLVLN